MGQDYLAIARSFTQSAKERTDAPAAPLAEGRQEIPPVAAEKPTVNSLRNKRNNELTTSALPEAAREPPAFPAVADPDTYYPTLGLTYGQIQGEWDSKPVLPGEQPVLQELLEQQEWLASVDWHQGLRCGKSGKQCRICRGIPCHDSTEWQSTI